MRRQRGVALITVLLVVAIVTVVCAGLIGRQQVSIRSIGNQMQARQAWQYALGGEALARTLLRRDLEDEGGAGAPDEDDAEDDEAADEEAGGGLGTGSGTGTGSETDAEQDPGATAPADASTGANGAAADAAAATAGEDGAAAVRVDHLGEDWAQPIAAFELDDGSLQVRIEDLAGRFNLNSLVQNQQANDAAIEQFQRLLLGLDIEAPYAQRLVDWMDVDQTTAGENGAEDSAYGLLDPPYRTAGRRLYDISELRLLLGMSERDFQRLAPHVAALPADVALNVNTVGAQVLASLDESLTLAAARAAVNNRKEGGYKDVAGFLAQPALAGTELEGTPLAVESQFFQATSEVSLGDRRLVLVSQLKREADGEVRVIYRDLGQRPTAPTPTANEGE
ncbi:type II secretion system minor pseudopilin GspK [Stutzerimonas urumqiensis]|uniref:type II secretion system minor pseudopilin GspK n=1 Tax=Stutzerimonas urumqiensis TaxID=638269 RepID=UPI003DA61B3D